MRLNHLTKRNETNWNFFLSRSLLEEDIIINSMRERQRKDKFVILEYIYDTNDQRKRTKWRLRILFCPARSFLLIHSMELTENGKDAMRAKKGEEEEKEKHGNVIVSGFFFESDEDVTIGLRMILLLFLIVCCWWRFFVHVEGKRAVRGERETRMLCSAVDLSTGNTWWW